jgi:hypothetical protein
MTGIRLRPDIPPRSDRFRPRSGPAVRDLHRQVMTEAVILADIPKTGWVKDGRLRLAETSAWRANLNTHFTGCGLQVARRAHMPWWRRDVRWGAAPRHVQAETSY